MIPQQICYCCPAVMSPADETLRLVVGIGGMIFLFLFFLWVIRDQEKQSEKLQEELHQYFESLRKALEDRT